MTVKELGRIDTAIPTAPSKASKKSPESTDRVSTNGSAEVEEAIRKAESTADVSHMRAVQAVADAVRRGAYKPDPQKIAQEIIQEAELLARMQSMLKR